MFDIYIAGELTLSSNPDQRKIFYERIAKACEEAGYSVYVPHLNSDPVTHPDISPQDVYDKNHEVVANAKMIIAYVGRPSLGVGEELEIAKNNNTEIILHFFNNERVSRMVLGNPGVVERITYDSEEDAITKIRQFLQKSRINK